MENDMIQYLLPHFTMEDAPKNYKYIIEDIGIENTIKLCRRTNGDDIYFPKVERILQKTRNRVMRQEYLKGKTYKELAKKYDISPTQVKNILLKG